MSAEQAEKQIFRKILLKKPSWQGLAGSELEDIITTYVGQRAEAVLFEIERGRQENFLQLARDRESILARAEAEGYVPALPKPLQMEVLITNEGTAPVSLKDLLNPPRPLELIADDETKMVLGDNLLSVQGPPTTEIEKTDNEPPKTSDEDEEDAELEPENTVTQISKDTKQIPIDSDTSELRLTTLGEMPSSWAHSTSHLVVIARESVDNEAKLYFRLFDKSGNVVCDSNEINLLSAKKELINALRNYLANLCEKDSFTNVEKTKIIEYFSAITDYHTSVEEKRVTVCDTYSTGETRETLTVTKTEMITEIDLETNQTSLKQKADNTVTVTTTESKGFASVIYTTRIKTDPNTKITTETVTTDGKNISQKIIDPNGHVEETLYDKPAEGQNTIIKTFVDLDKARIKTETVREENEIVGEITLTKTVEDDDKLTVTVIKRPSYFTPGRIENKTITYNEDETLRSIYIKPSVETLEANGEIRENKGKIIQGGYEPDGEVEIILTNGTTTNTVRTTKDNDVTFQTAITYPDGAQKTTITVATGDGATTTTETDSNTGTTTTTEIDSKGAKTVNMEFGDLPAGGSAVVNARQLWKEVRHFRTSPEPGKVFQEFIIGGPDEHGEFTIHDFEVEITGEQWKKERNFLNGDAESKIYHVYYRLSDELAFRLGDGEVGQIPPPESGVKVTVWHTSGDRVFMTPGQDITPLVDTEEPMTVNGQTSLVFTGGRILESGQPLENIELVRKSVLSHIQIGGVAARNVDYEYKIRRRFPDLLYLKVWGEKEQRAYDEKMSEKVKRTYYINKAFFTFLIAREDWEKDDNDPDYRARVVNVQTAIKDYFNNEIKPMNVEPEHKEIITHAFKITIEGAIDRVYPDISVAEQEIKDLLDVVFGRNRNEKNFLDKKFADSDKRDKFMKLFQRYARLNGLPKESDIHYALRESGYFRDARPHLNRRNRPYYEVTLDKNTPDNDFFDQYVYLEQIEFIHKDKENKETAEGLCYADNF